MKQGISLLVKFGIILNTNINITIRFQNQLILMLVLIRYSMTLNRVSIGAVIAIWFIPHKRIACYL